MCKCGGTKVSKNKCADYAQDVHTSTLPYFHTPTQPYHLLVAGAVVALLALGGWLALGPDVPLHEDEAVYAAWARTILLDDPLLRVTPVDKPPLFLYTLAGTFRLLDVSAAVARLPNLVVMAVVVLVTARLSRRPAVAAVLLVTVPLTVFFAASAFTDPPMLAFVLLGWYGAQRERFGWAGIACACAMLTKPTAVFLWPLVLVEVWHRRERVAIRPFVLGVATPLAVAWAWDASRTAPSWWLLGREAYGTLGRPVLGDVATWWTPALLGLGVSWLGLIAFRRSRRTQFVALLVVLWVPLHVLLGFQQWDRYLLPLAPLLAWLAAEGLPTRLVRPLVLANVLLLLSLLALPAPGLAGRDGRWTGVTEMGTFLHTLSDDTTIYHRELGRPLAFYAPMVTERLVWLPSNENPPAGAVWAGRRDDRPCGRILWESRGTLVVCRVAE